MKQKRKEDIKKEKENKNRERKETQFIAKFFSPWYKQIKQNQTDT